MGKSVAIALAMLLWTANAAAAPCAGFVDVDSTNAFCPNVEYLKSRGVTVGCTDTAHYCPTDAVTRLQMAVFLNRLGNATALPTWVDATGKVMGLVNGGSPANPVGGGTEFLLRTPYGQTPIGGMSADVVTGLGHWTNGYPVGPNEALYYPTGDCSGQGYSRAYFGWPVQGIMIGSRLHLFRIHSEDVPAPVPGVYLGGFANVSLWSGSVPTVCTVVAVSQSQLYVRADDIGDITNLFVEPFHIE